MDLWLYDVDVNIRMLRTNALSEARFPRRSYLHDGTVMWQDIVTKMSGDPNRAFHYRYRSNRARCLFYIPVERDPTCEEADLRESGYLRGDTNRTRLTLARSASFPYHCTFRPMVAVPRSQPTTLGSSRLADYHRTRLIRDEHALPEESYQEWFKSALSGIAETADFSILHIEEQRVWTESCDGTWYMEKGNEVSCKGVLTVLDTHAFSQALFNGIGVHARLGYGLIALKV